MRRVLLAVTLGLTLVTAAACADTPQVSAQPTPSGATASAVASAEPSAGTSGGTGSVTGTGDSKAVCAAANEAGNKFATTIITKAQSAGTALSDPAKAKAFLDDLAKDYVTLSTALKAQSEKASDPALKKALQDMGKALDGSLAALSDPQKLSQDPSKIQEILFSADLTAAGNAFDKLCPSS